MQTGGQWTMATNRGPYAVGAAPDADGPTPAAPSSAMADHNNSEYYKARNAQGGQSLSWATGGVGVGGPAAAPPAPGPSGVGGSWASAPVAPPPQPPAHQMSVAARSRAAAHAQGGGIVAPAIPVTSNSNGFGGVGGGAGGGAYEKNLISELCPPGGMKAEPPIDKLSEFANAIPSLNPDLVCPALLDALEEGNPWIMRAKALCVIETVLNVEAAEEGGGASQNAYTDFFHACSGEIEPLANHARASVKAPAKRVLAALGIDAGTAMANGDAPAFAAPVAAPVAPPTNLLDFDEPATQVPTPVVPTQAAPGTGAPSALFSGLNTKAAAPAPLQPTAPAAPVATPSPAPVVAQPQQQNDLFGGMSVANASTSAPAVNGGSNDLFGDMTVKSTTSDVTPIEPPASAAAPTAVSGSAFGFMNATGPTSPVPPPAPQATPTPASPKSFDPLLSMGMPVNNMPASPNSNNANQMAQMQQMQMAYQQNMMMMQQQMQQMQMANYQRQGSNNNNIGGVPPLPMPGMASTTSKQPIMTANYMRQVPGVGDNMSSFSFLGSDPSKKKDNHSFDFVQDAMKSSK
mmetsp:Transcript_28949/g.60246  ORF Transcript_28949/g.60246 Transcript_28949/m.60246 type:complete len:574 (+) Transcript_28949:1364-3085(+)